MAYRREILRREFYPPKIARYMLKAGAREMNEWKAIAKERGITIAALIRAAVREYVK